MKRTGRQKDIVTPEKKQEQRELLRLFSANIRKILKNTDLLADDLQEIRLRTGAPLLVVAKDQEYFLTPDGALTGEWEKGYPVSPTDIRDTMDYIGSFSLYAYEDELRQGFLTVEGGHRIGIAGKTVIEGEKVKGISHISCINVRVAHEKKGCADRVMPYLWEDGRFLHTLIVSAPGCGKTTMLRDIIRQISDGESPYPGLTVGVVDERSEIAGCYLGVAQNDVGIRTDVLDCCPKAEGMMMLIRAMSPDVVAVDEIRIRDTAQSHERIFFIEVMGRDAGFLAQNSAIASGAEAAIIPEDSTDVDQLAQFMERGIRKSKKSCIVIVSESPKCGALYYADRVRKEFPEFDVRVSILGHLQRGGRPSARDRILASRTGCGAIEAIMQGQRNVMIGVRNNEVVYVPLSEAIRSDKPFDRKLIKVLDELSI